MFKKPKKLTRYYIAEYMSKSEKHIEKCRQDSSDFSATILSVSSQQTQLRLLVLIFVVVVLTSIIEAVGCEAERNHQSNHGEKGAWTADVDSTVPLA